MYKTPTLRKPIIVLIKNMAMSDLLFAIFSFPANLARLHSSWFIGGILGQAFCKIQTFHGDIFLKVLIQSLVLIINSGSIWKCRNSTSFPSHNQQAVSILHCRYLYRRNCGSLVISCCCQTCLIPWRDDVQESVTGSLQGNQICKLPPSKCYIVFFYIPPVFLVILYFWPIDQVDSSVANAEEQRTSEVLKIAVTTVVVFLICWIQVTINLVLADLATEKCYSILLIYLSHFYQ